MKARLEAVARVFPGGPVVENRPSNAGDMGSIPVGELDPPCPGAIREANTLQLQGPCAATKTLLRTAQLCLTLCGPTDCSPVLHYLLEFAQTQRSNAAKNNK